MPTPTFPKLGRLIRRVRPGGRSRTAMRSKPAGGDGGGGGFVESVGVSGVEIEVSGPLARRVFGEENPAGYRSQGGPVDVMLVDTTRDARWGTSPTVVLESLPPIYSVPAFDPTVTNPSGWKRQPTEGVGVLGSAPEWLADAGDVQRVTRKRRSVLRRLHHLEDVAAFHPDVITRASRLAALSALGVVVRLADKDQGLRQYLGPDLYRLMSSGGIRGAGIHRRERMSVAMRRAALRDHSLPGRCRDLMGALLPDTFAYPMVSVLAATRRPHLVPGLLDTVARQTYPELELILILHGTGFGPDIEAYVVESDVPATVVRVPSHRSLGSALNEGGATATGALLTKMDDDDAYADDHVLDLVLAYQHSGAEVVAKGAEFVYLAHTDRTIHRYCGGGEKLTDGPVAGAAMLIGRPALESVGGWRSLTLGEDRALLQDIRDEGGRVYRTHGFGFITVRHGKGHTWEVGDEYFLDQAEDARAGWAPEFAGLDSATECPSAPT